MRKMEMTKKHSLVRAMALFACISVLIIGSFACDDRKDGSSAHSGKLRLSLAADTTSLKKGVNSNLTKAVSDEFEKFLTVEDYQIRIVTDKDTVKSYDRFDKMPSEIELPEGAYTIVASKGNNLPAEFENPYFEGSTDFTIKEDMSTPLDMTCTLGNARVTAEYTDDFKEAYSDYTVLLSSSFATTEFEIAKGETRPAYMLVEKEGTDVAIGIRLKKVNAEEEKTYYVPTALKLERRQNVRLIFKTDGEALEGIGLTIMLDDSLEEKTFTTKIPDFMWKPFDKPTLSPTGFKSGDKFELRSGLFNENPYIGINMPGGIGSLDIKYWKEGELEEDATVYDLATDAGVKAAKKQHYTWSVGEKEDLNISKEKVAILYLKGGLNSLSSSDKETYTYHYKIYGTDATGKAYESNIVSFDVDVLQADAPQITVVPSESEYEIVEGDELAMDWKFSFMATGLIDEEATKVVVNDGISDTEYDFMADKGESLKRSYGAVTEITNNANVVLTFPKAFSSKLKAPETGHTVYTFTFYLKDQKGKVHSLKKTVTVLAPVFTLETTDNDAFARRIVLRVNTTNKEDEKHLSFEYRPKGGLNWLPVKSSGLISVKSHLNPALIQCVDTLKNVTNKTSYELRALYQGVKIRESNVVEVQTENANYSLPNAGFDTWFVEKGSDNWEIYYPWENGNESTKGWNTINQKTTGDGGTSFTNKYRYIANSGTIATEDANGISNSAALVRTVGWGSGTTAAGGASIIKKSDPGELYLGTYEGGPVYGIGFASRPSGFSFQYKYEKPMKGDDEFTAEIVVYDEKDQIIAKQFKSSAVTSGWKRMTVYLDYPEGAMKAKKMYIRFVSGKTGAYKYADFPVQAPNMDLSNGEYTGSHLYIDNVELIYE